MASSCGCSGNNQKNNTRETFKYEEIYHGFNQDICRVYYGEHEKEDYSYCCKDWKCFDYPNIYRGFNHKVFVPPENLKCPCKHRY